jgi:large-conductance mechanosensitive channel
MSFLKFLEENQILQTALGIVLATSISNFVNTVVKVFIDPLVNKIAGEEQKYKKIKIFGTEVFIGIFIIELIDFIIIIILMYIITKHIIKSKGSLNSGKFIIT